MLSGFMPFGGNSTEEVFKSIKKGKLDFTGTEWEPASDLARDLIQQLLETDEKKRPSAKDALKHP